MIDLYLKAPTEADLKDALPWLVNENGDWIRASHQWAFDPIGSLVQTPVVIDPATGTVTSEAAYYPGWHANLRLLDETLHASVPSSVQITVTSPSRVWA